MKAWDPLQAWQATWQALQACPPPGLYEALITAYSEPHRSYHNLRHLAECFDKYNELRLLADHPAELEIALWFHDVVYDVRRHDNEEKSATWARASLGACGMAEDRVERVCKLVLATRHEQQLTVDNDTAILIDVDLAILGAPVVRFDEYERQIREEYRHVPPQSFDLKRRAILEEFLAKPRIFSTLLFHARYEQQARSNLARSLQKG